MPARLRCVQGHEQGAVYPAPVCLFHSQELLLIILLYVVQHFWLASGEYSTHRPLYSSLHQQPDCLETRLTVIRLQTYVAVACMLTMRAGLAISVPNLYRQETHRKSASRSAQPATEKGTPCSEQCAIIATCDAQQTMKSSLHSLNWVLWQQPQKIVEKQDSR